MKTKKQKLIMKLFLMGAALSFVGIPTVAVLTSCSNGDSKPVPKVTFTTTLTYDANALNGDSQTGKGAYIVPLTDQAKIASCDELTIAGPTAETLGNNTPIFQAPNWLQQDDKGKAVDTYKQITKITLDLGAITSVWNTNKDLGMGVISIPSGVSQVTVKTKKLEFLIIYGAKTNAKLKVDLTQALLMHGFGVDDCPNYVGTNTTLNTEIWALDVNGGTFETWDVSKNTKLQELSFKNCPNLQSLDLTKNVDLVSMSLDKSTSLKSLTLPSIPATTDVTLDVSGCSSLTEITNIKHITVPSDSTLTITYDSNTSQSLDTTTNYGNNITFVKAS